MLLRMTTSGLYCEAGGFHIDPCGPVARAVVTHAHSDHFVSGCRSYLTTPETRRILLSRLPNGAWVEPLSYGQPLRCGGVTVSFHPAGHVLGSAQVRIEHRGEVWVVTGDYHRADNTTCAAFEPVTCHQLVTESTFGHPHFRWPETADVIAELHRWWRENQAAGRASLVFAYSFGKAQRLLAELDGSIGPVLVTSDIASINAHYEAAGVELGPTQVANDLELDALWPQTLIVAPPSARWRQPFPFAGPYATACASGWMLLTGQARKRRVETGFALSDHVDHPGILATIDESQAETVWVTHGYIDPLVAELNSRGLDARPLRSPRCTNPPAVPSAQQRELVFGEPA